MEYQWSGEMPIVAEGSDKGERRAWGRECRRWQAAQWVVGLMLLMVVACGCSTTAMKATPFYTGTHEVQTLGENRVNVWPLFYYREPIFSLLWPLCEYSDDYFALRPLFSIEHLDREKPTYNLLWPLGRFDSYRENYRFFPIFWGKDYCTVFPLYWHFGHPFDKESDGVEALWPLWCYFSDREQYNLHLLWPLFNVRSYDGIEGWHLWPLYGRYQNRERESGYSYALWPLAWHSWEREQERRMLLPLYYYSAKEGDSRTVATILGGWHRNYQSDTLEWYALPLLGLGESTPAFRRTTALLGLYGSYQDASRHHSRLLPLYYSSESAERSLFVSPLYATGSAADERSWRLIVPLALQHRTKSASALYTPLYSQGASASSRWSCLLPLYYESSSEGGSTFVTPLGGWGEDAERRRWAIYPLLSGGSQRADGGELWLGGPLFHAAWSESGSSSWLLPLYYRSRDAERSRFISPLYSYSAEASSRWSCLVPLYYRSRDAERSRFISPLYSYSAEASSRWSCLVPLYYRSRDAEQSRFISPLYSYSAEASSRWSCLVPLYYSQSSETGSSFKTLLGGWGEEAQERHWAIYPLLSGGSRRADGGELWLGGPLYHAEWSASSSLSWLLPLYYRANDTFLTPLFGHWREAESSKRYWLTPLLGTSSGAQRGSWFFPLYSHLYDESRQATRGRFLILGSYRTTAQEQKTAFPILFKHESWRPRVATEGRDGWLFNLLLLGQRVSYDYTVNVQAPLSSAIGNRRLPPLEIDEPLHRNEFYLFPLWSHYSDRALNSDWRRAKGNLFLGLYDYVHERGVVNASDKEVKEYKRRRLLWRIYHYERLDEVTSIDIFPAMTYDRNEAADTRKFSLLWRIFRYELTADRRCIDLLFVPIWRGKRALTQAESSQE